MAMERIHHSAERFLPSVRQVRGNDLCSKSRLQRPYVQLNCLVHRVLLNVAGLPERNRETASDHIMT
jgi:hypothetical protein